jgi:serine/threonine-protein kinase HipA
MTPSIPHLDVYADADGTSLLLGRLDYDAGLGSGRFQWSETARAAGVEWSPLFMPLAQPVWTPGVHDVHLWGLPGLIHDALPDGWGLLLMDRRFGQAGTHRADISPLSRLSLLHDRCWGALRFEPDFFMHAHEPIAIEAMSDQIHAIAREGAPVSELMMLAGGAPHGAKPKIMAGIDDTHDHVLVGQENLPPGYRPVLIKWASQGETPAHLVLEYLYIEAARQVGITTMPATLLRDGLHGVCFDRFDRQGGQRQHVHSMAGMLHTTHRIANADWTQVASILKTLLGGARDLAQAFRRAVFNCVFSVRDDHTKNLSFLREPDGQWSLAPAYDLCYCEGPGGWHTMTYANHAGQHVTMKDLLSLAPYFDVDSQSVEHLVQEMMQARGAMMVQAKQRGIGSAMLNTLKARFKQIDGKL